jgi:hypothetical protein
MDGEAFHNSKDHTADADDICMWHSHDDVSFWKIDSSLVFLANKTRELGDLDG